MDYDRASSSTLTVLDLMPGDVLRYRAGEGALRQFVLRDSHPACAALGVNGQPFDLLPGAEPAAIDGVYLWYDRLDERRLRLALWAMQGDQGAGRICPERLRWPNTHDEPPLLVDAVTPTDGGWVATRVWPDGTVWRLTSRQGELAWFVYQAESGYQLDTRLLRWQAARDERHRLGLPLATMPALGPSRVGQRVHLIYLGDQDDVRWKPGDAPWVDGPYAETTFTLPGVHAVELQVGRGASADSAVQWVTVSD